MRALLLLILVGGCFRVGPVKVGLLPPIPNDQREPDRTRNFIAEPSAPDGEGGVTAAGEDPLRVGPVSVGVSAASFMLWQLVGIRPFFGLHGTFDETGLVELDPEKREQDKLRTKAAQEPVDEPRSGAGPAREEQ
jgi:hypothetical protein